MGLSPYGYLSRPITPLPCYSTWRSAYAPWRHCLTRESGRVSSSARHCRLRCARPAARAGELSPATRHRRLVALRTFLRFGAREGWTTGDLGVTIDLPKLPRRLPKPLEDEELTALTAPARVELDPPGLRDRALVALLISTGCRISEILALNRADWDKKRLFVLGKGDSERTVVVTDRARNEVDAYLASRTGRRLSVRGAEAICTSLGARSAIAGLHPHRLRHTAGTIVQDEIGDARLTAEYLGHHGLGSVAGYTEVSRQRHQQAADALTDRGA
jgi:site-specific recombinase XerD